MAWVIAGVTIGSALLGAHSARSASRTQSDAATNAANQQEAAAERARQDLAPFRDAGASALNPLMDMVGASYDTPLTRTQGFTDIQQSAAAAGKLRSGGTLKALTQFNSMLNESNRATRFNELFNLATLGSNAAAGQGTATIQGAARAGEYGTQAANASAAGTIGQSNAITGALQNFAFLNLLNKKPSPI